MDDRHVDDDESESSEPDRISELPSFLIHTILSYLEMKDVVMTTLLSKRWNNVWTTLPYLHFHRRSHSIWINSNIRNSNIWDDFDYLHAFRKFVNSALGQWKGTKIVRFSLDFTFDMSISSDLDSWLVFAVEKQVEELSVKLAGLEIKLYCWESEYYVPQCVFSCSSIRELTLVSCKVKIGDGVRWNRLESFLIEGNGSLIEDAMSTILCGAPRLEFLNVRVVESKKDLKVISSRLKMLKVDRFMVDAMGNTKLTISAPNLESLELTGVSYSRLSLDVPCLTSAVLGFNNWDYGTEERYSDKLYVEDMLMRVFVSIRRVEELTLSASWLKVLRQLKTREKFVEFPNIKFLKLCVRAAEDILVALDMFPKMMVLVLQLENRQSHLLRSHYRRACNLFEADPSFSTCPLPHLRTVDITWHSFDTSIVPIIEFVLEKAHTLQKMVFRCKLYGAISGSFFSEEDKLLNIPRSSPTAEMIIIKDT